MVSEAILMLIVNNSFILAGACVRYLGDSTCMKMLCCRGALEIDDLRHENSKLKRDADNAINSLSSTQQTPVQMNMNTK